MTTNTDWIEWAGGECPVPGDTIVDVKHMDGDITPHTLARDLIYEDPRVGYDWWAHEDTEDSIDGYVIAYRIVKP